jgi:hypothetical protein
MNQDHLITLRTFPNEIDAKIAAQHLHANQVDSFIKKDDSGGMRPHLQFSQGVDLIVSEKDAPKAIKILAAMKV